MLFNSYSFILFFALMLLLHHLPFSWTTKKRNLLLGSYLFYAAWNPPFILLLWLSTVVDFYVGRALYREHRERRRKLLLALSLAGNLGMLCFFKYGSFLLDNFVALVNLAGIDYQPAAPNIILPAGISFYTFTTLCYTVDMYKRHSKPVSNLLDFSLFVTFFPHLVAGPIVRPEQLAPQFDTPKQASREQLVHGLFLLTLGLFLKVVLADTFLAGPSDLVFNFQHALLPLDAWIGVLAFSGQIFFDFAGYSTCAIGAALCLGFTLPQNFRFPYAAIGFSDFWKRWHITLSAWLRDYLYIPLGGNRAGRMRTYRNLMITMLLGGLWHGASWTFVAWGALHGFYLCVEKWIADRGRKRVVVDEHEAALAPASMDVVRASFTPAFLYRPAVRLFLGALATYLLVTVAWVFFRAADFPTAWRLLISMSGGAAKGAALLPTLDILVVSLITVVMLLMQWRLRNRSVSGLLSRLPAWAIALAWTAMLVLIILSQKSSSSFIYFQF